MNSIQGPGEGHIYHSDVRLPSHHHRSKHLSIVHKLFLNHSERRRVVHRAKYQQVPTYPQCDIITRSEEPVQGSASAKSSLLENRNWIPSECNLDRWQENWGLIVKRDCESPQHPTRAKCCLYRISPKKHPSYKRCNEPHFTGLTERGRQGKAADAGRCHCHRCSTYD